MGSSQNSQNNSSVIQRNNNDSKNELMNADYITKPSEKKAENSLMESIRAQSAAPPSGKD
jgi:hypothetical protein